MLITTYTQANETEIRKKIIEKNKCIPKNIVVQTWFSFLLKHGARPFQGVLFEKKIKGLILVNSQSGQKGSTRAGQPIYFGEKKEFEQHYFSNSQKIYSDKLSKFVFRCNERSKGNVIDRISRIYSHIFVDEVQDLAGYDLDILRLFFDCKSTILLVGDPRQGTYSTNSASKNRKFRKANIVNFFTDQIGNLAKDDTSLMVNHRCNQPICELSNKLFPKFQATTSSNNTQTEHNGVFYINEENIDDYIKKFQPIQLRNDRKENRIRENCQVMNFGEAKGLSFDRVLIYPTKPILNWLKDNNTTLAETSRSKLYVAITRARFSVAIVNDEEKTGSLIPHYKFNTENQPQK